MAGSFVIFQVKRGGSEGGGGGRGQEGAAEVHTSITKEAYSFVIFQIGGPLIPPTPPSLDRCMVSV